MAAEPPNLSDRQIRVYTGRTRDPQLIPLPLQSTAQLARSAARVRETRRRSRSGRRDPAVEGRPPGRAASGHLRGRPGARRSRPREEDGPRGSQPRIGPLRRHTCTAPAPRHRPRDGRSRPRTSWPTRPSPPRSSSSSASGQEASSPSRTSKGSTAERSSAPGTGAPTCRPRSSPSTVSAATAGSRSPSGWLVESSQPADERTDRRRTRRCRRSRPHDRSPAARTPPSRSRSRSRPPQAPSSRSRSSP